MTTLHLHACADDATGEPGYDVDWTLMEHRESAPEDFVGGRRLLVAAASTPPTLIYEAQVTAAVESRYTSKTDAWQQLRSLGATASPSREAFLFAPATLDAPDQGWLLGWRYAVVHRLGLVLPTEVVMVHGWARVDHVRLAEPALTSPRPGEDNDSPERAFEAALDPALAALVQLRALEVARHWLHASGYLPIEVRDAVPGEPYDLLAETDTRRLSVVVRGLVGELRPVSVTGPEIQASFQEPTTMLVVHRIDLLRDAAGAWSATGGQVHQIRPWRPQKPALLPTSFRFDPAGTGRFAWYRDVWHPGPNVGSPESPARPPLDERPEPHLCPNCLSPGQETGGASRTTPDWSCPVCCTGWGGSK
ncbi:MAG: hypothetical protein ACXV3F_15660 [Frankiaceae bacterium]